MKILYLIYSFFVHTLVIKSADSCTIRCLFWTCCKPAPLPPVPSPPNGPTQMPWCKRKPCDFDLDTEPEYQNPNSCKPLTDETGRCDAPTNSQVTDVILPAVSDPVPGFLAAITDQSSKPICSAIILTGHFVLTSCMKCLYTFGRNVPKHSIKVALGAIDPDEVDGMVLVNYAVQQVIHNPGCYTSDRYNPSYDLSLVMTKEEMEYESDMVAATIPAKPGWRSNINKNWFMSALRVRNTAAVHRRDATWSIKVRNLQFRVCTDALNLNNQTIDSLRANHHYCTAYNHDTRNDGCRDDFGSPLYYDNLVFGLLIFKYSCGRAKSAGAFVNIAHNSEWISETVLKYTNKKELVKTI